LQVSTTSGFVSALPPGVYLLRLHTDRAVAVRKVVKE
jgi:hypothetical protein